jgi:hypothetical protein
MSRFLGEKKKKKRFKSTILMFSKRLDFWKKKESTIILGKYLGN